MARKWIQAAKPKKDALSKQLGIPAKKNIPMSLLAKIVNARPGTTISNPTGVGRRRIKVTPLLQRRANMAITLKRMNKR